MVWNVTKDKIRVRLAVAAEETWSPPLAGKAELPRDDDKQNFAEKAGIPIESMGYTDFIAGGSWDGVDDALRGVYEEASEALGQAFKYPKD